jgi:hypothetical protein
VGVRPIAGPEELAALAKVVSHSALVLRADHAYQRELSAWTAPIREPLPGAGVSAAIRRTATLPWAGLVRRTTAVLDVETLAGSLLTQPLQLSESRAGLVEALTLNGFPQLLLRFGHRNDLHEER